MADAVRPISTARTCADTQMTNADPGGLHLRRCPARTGRTGGRPGATELTHDAQAGCSEPREGNRGSLAGGAVPESRPRGSKTNSMGSKITAEVRAIVAGAARTRLRLRSPRVARGSRARDRIGAHASGACRSCTITVNVTHPKCGLASAYSRAREVPGARRCRGVASRVHRRPVLIAAVSRAAHVRHASPSASVAESAVYRRKRAESGGWTRVRAGTAFDIPVTHL